MSMSSLERNLYQSRPVKPASGSRARILLGQLGRRGDCIFATALARQIKNDFPDCELIWAVGTACREIVERCLFVDTVWEISEASVQTDYGSWKSFTDVVHGMLDQGEIQRAFLSQVYPGNFSHYDGTCRASILGAYPGALTQGVQPCIQLNGDDVANVDAFAARNSLHVHDQVVIFECESSSGQSTLTPDAALWVARVLVDRHPSCCIVLSSTQPFETDHPRIVDASSLSFVENAHLTRYCTLLVGCSSGISWLATSDWAKPLPKVQILSGSSGVYASMAHDASYWGLAEDEVLELRDSSIDTVLACVDAILSSGFAKARDLYHMPPRVDFRFYFMQLYCELLCRGRLVEAAESLVTTHKRYAGHPQLVRFIARVFLPYVALAGRGNKGAVPPDVLRPLLEAVGWVGLPSTPVALGSLVRSSFTRDSGAFARRLLMSVLL